MSNLTFDIAWSGEHDCPCLFVFGEFTDESDAEIIIDRARVEGALTFVGDDEQMVILFPGSRNPDTYNESDVRDTVRFALRHSAART